MLCTRVMRMLAVCLCLNGFFHSSFLLYLFYLFICAEQRSHIVYVSLSHWLHSLRASFLTLSPLTRITFSCILLSFVHILSHSLSLSRAIFTCHTECIKCVGTMYNRYIGTRNKGKVDKSIGYTYNIHTYTLHWHFVLFFSSFFSHFILIRFSYVSLYISIYRHFFFFHFAYYPCHRFLIRYYYYYYYYHYCIWWCVCVYFFPFFLYFRLSHSLARFIRLS